MVTQSTINFIAGFEGFRSKKYLDPTGHWSIGFGHLCTDSTPSKISYEYALKLLSDDVLVHHDEFVRWLDSIEVDNHFHLNQNEMDAFVSFVYNVGMTKFKTYQIADFLTIYLYHKRHGNHPDSLQVLRKHVASLFTVYNKSAGKVLEGLNYRRHREAKRFLTPETIN